MPILTDTVRIGYKLLPLRLDASGGSEVTLRRGFVAVDGGWSDVDQKTFLFDEAETSLILDAMPTAGPSRRDDLAYAIFAHLVERGLAPAGEIA